MAAGQRRQAIHRLVLERGGVEISQLVTQFGVSSDTVRRDLAVLEAAGRVRRVWGGAVGAAGAPARDVTYTRIKRIVAGAAAELVRPGQTVALSAGSTTAAVARVLATIPDLTVVTNSLPAARILRGAGNGLQLVLTGGVPGIVGALLGPIAVDAVRTLNPDWLFLGANGVHGNAGITAFDLDEAELHREWAAHARNVVVVTDHSKWGVTALSTVLPLPRVAVLVTDDGLPDGARRIASRSVGHLILTPS